jgi:hypothetical protein
VCVCACVRACVRVCVCVKVLTNLAGLQSDPHVWKRHGKKVSNGSQPSSSVSIVSGYGLDDRAIEARSPAEAKGFFL